MSLITITLFNDPVKVTHIYNLPTGEKTIVELPPVRRPKENLYQKQDSIKNALVFIDTPEDRRDNTDWIQRYGQLAGPKELDFTNKLLALGYNKDVKTFVSMLSNASKKRFEDQAHKTTVHVMVHKIKNGTFNYSQHDYKFFATFRKFTEEDWQDIGKRFDQRPTHILALWHFNRPNYGLIGGSFYLKEAEGSYKLIIDNAKAPQDAFRQDQPQENKVYGIAKFKQNDQAYSQPDFYKYNWSIQVNEQVSTNNTFQLLKITRVISGRTDLHPKVALQKIIDKSMVEKYKYKGFNCRIYLGESEPDFTRHNYGQKLSGWSCGLSIASVGRSTTMFFPGKDVTNIKIKKQGDFIGSDLELISFETSGENVRYENKVILRLTKIETDDTSAPAKQGTR